MKVLVVLVCFLSALARASLEPAGYVPPGSYPEPSYLPPSNGVTESRYIPSSVGFNSDGATFDNQLSTGLSLPSKNSPVPFRQYMSHNRQRSRQGVSAFRGSNFGEDSRPASRYIAANENSFVKNPPASDFEPPRQNGNRVSGPSNSYLAPNVQSGRSSDGFSGQLGFASMGHYSGATSANRHSMIDQEMSGHHSYGHVGQNSASGSAGYRYNAPENDAPAKYNFEYKVKDNYGNDYGHAESRNGEITQGVYTVLLPDGRRQIVHYEADSHGYRPTITYEEAGSQSGYNNQGYQYP